MGTDWIGNISSRPHQSVSRYLISSVTIPLLCSFHGRVDEYKQREDDIPGGGDFSRRSTRKSVLLEENEETKRLFNRLRCDLNVFWPMLRTQDIPRDTYG